MAQMPSPEARTLLVKASRWCRDTFVSDRDQLERCIGAFRAPSGEEARARLLCTMVGGTPEEREECAALQRGVSAAEALRLLSRRFSLRDVENAQRLLQTKAQHDGDVYGAEDLFALYERLPAPAQPLPPPPPKTAEEVVREAEARGMVPFRRAPPAPPPLRAPIAPPTPGFSQAILKCLKGAGLPAPLLDAVLGAAENIEQVHVGGDESKLNELCHQIQDAGTAVAGLLRPAEAPLVIIEEVGHETPEVPPLETFFRCLCPEGSKHVSLLQAITGGAS